MKKRTFPGRFLSLVLVLVLCLSTPLTALAAETDQASVETTAGNYEAVDVVITIQEVTNADGSISSQMTAQADGYVTESGLIVDYDASSSVHTAVDGVTTGEAQSEYSVTNAAGTYGAEGGTELTVTPAAPEVTVELSLTGDAPDNQNTATTQDPEGTSVLAGDAKENDADGTYDYTVTTVEQQGSVTLTTTEVTVTESADASHTQMDYVHSSAEASAENDLIHVDTDYNEPLDPDSLDVAEGYTHIYLGADNYSVFAQPWSAGKVSRVKSLCLSLTACPIMSRAATLYLKRESSMWTITISTASMWMKRPMPDGTISSNSPLWTPRPAS